MTPASAAAPAPPQDRPLSTYRLQFNKDFTFRNAIEIIPYLSRLGTSHVYASPYLRATSGSTHGYDVVNPEMLNPELGSEADYQAFIDTLHAHKMSHIVDIVPNHMGVGTDQNPWWNSVLEFGEASPFAAYFDIAWEDYANALDRHQVMLPILGDALETVINAGQLKLAADSGGVWLMCYDRRLPLSVESYAVLVGDEPQFDSLKKSINALPEDYSDRYRTTIQIKEQFAGLLVDENLLRTLQLSLAKVSIADILRLQHYRLAYWRDANKCMNYRRFFEVSELAAIQTEREDVFDRTHALILRRLASGDIAGLRIDHPDGLADLGQYFDCLQTTFQRERAKLGRTDSSGSLYVLAEKILAMDETLHEDWAIDGTTGYDFMARVNALLVNPKGREPLTTIYREFSGQSATFSEVAVECKQQVLRNYFARELTAVAKRVQAMLGQVMPKLSASVEEIEMAMGKLIVHFPIYRPYLTPGLAEAADRAAVDQTLVSIAKTEPQYASALLKIIRDLLLWDGVFADHPEQKSQRWPIVKRFQQLTAPVTAKGVEDTAMYRYHRLISLNEVGADPDYFGLSSQRLHEDFRHRQQRWPFAMSSLSTHDTKRSEDVRARLHVLADVPHRFGDAVLRWSRMNAGIASSDSSRLDANTEYLVYQTLLGVWPADCDRCDESLIARIQAYLLKAVRESKAFTSWPQQDEEYEGKLQSFVADIFDVKKSAAFLTDFAPFARSLARMGYINSLSQTLIKLTAPGMPDTYQGTEVWDDSLVDPDNRRAVNYAAREKMLSAMEYQPPAIADMLASPHEGRLKLFVNWKALQIRREFAACFQSGSYLPAEVRGDGADFLFAFAREHATGTVLTVVPRFPGEWMLFTPDAPLQVPAGLFGDAALEAGPSTTYQNVFTGKDHRSDGSGALKIADLLAGFPVALLIRRD